jgi:hypothetical protein
VDGDVVKKANISDLVVVATSPTYGGDVSSVVAVGGFVYYGGNTANKVIKTNSDAISKTAVYTRVPAPKGKLYRDASKNVYKSIFELNVAGTYNLLGLRRV